MFPAHSNSAIASAEFLCVGNAGQGYIKAQISVRWFEVLVDEVCKRVDVIEHYLPIKKHWREDRVNHCLFEIPEGVVCFYDRRVQVKPSVNESKFFTMENGEFKELAGGDFSDFYTIFLRNYQGYDICSGGSRQQVQENRERRVELDKLGPGCFCIETRTESN